MRLWSIHPEYLDAKGLVALWREALLAQKVLMGETRGYKNHPQLQRFKNTDDPISTIATYLHYVHIEADARGYQFNRNKIVKEISELKLPVTQGQIDYEFAHLLKKLKARGPESYKKLRKIKEIHPHPAFYIVPGNLEEWEITR
ncbi:MAG: DNA lyase [Nitrospinae bacterium]|nr:DNA lyase [Nitrospinota bacterium]